RLVVAGERDADPIPFAARDSHAADDEAIDAAFKAATVAEADRLRRARAMTNRRDEPLVAALEGDGPWVMAASGRRRLRAALGAHALLLWRVGLENASGQILAARLVPVTIDGLPRVTTHAAMKRLVGAVCQRLAPEID